MVEQKLRDKAAQKACEDQLLQEVKALMAELSDDMRCLYQIQGPQLDGIEVTLLALKGEHLNGNAMRRLRTSGRPGRGSTSD
jgi:galactokinase